MPEVDPATLARFVESRSAAADPGRFARVNPNLNAANEPPSRSEQWAFQRLRQSVSVMGAMFRGLESQIGAAQALEVVAEIHLASKAVA